MWTPGLSSPKSRSYPACTKYTGRIRRILCVPALSHIYCVTSGKCFSFTGLRLQSSKKKKKCVLPSSHSHRMCSISCSVSSRFKACGWGMPGDSAKVITPAAVGWVLTQHSQSQPQLLECQGVARAMTSSPPASSHHP